MRAFTRPALQGEPIAGRLTLPGTTAADAAAAEGEDRLLSDTRTDAAVSAAVTIAYGAVAVLGAPSLQGSEPDSAPPSVVAEPMATTDGASVAASGDHAVVAANAPVAVDAPDPSQPVSPPPTFMTRHPRPQKGDRHPRPIGSRRRRHPSSEPATAPPSGDRALLPADSSEPPLVSPAPPVMLLGTGPLRRRTA